MVMMIKVAMTVVNNVNVGALPRRYARAAVLAGALLLIII